MGQKEIALQGSFVFLANFSVGKALSSIEMLLQNRPIEQLNRTNLEKIEPKEN